MKKKILSAPVLIVLAIAQNPFMGRTRNVLGNVVASTWNSLNVWRAKPLSVANPNTLAQQTQRLRTKVNAEIGKIFGPVSTIGFRTRPAGQSARSESLKTNFPAITAAGDPPVATIDWTSLKTAKGAMTPTAISGVTSSNGSASVTITFSNSAADSTQSTTDKAYAVVVNETQGNIAGYSNGSVARSAGTLSITMPNACATSDDLHCYLFFASVSDSKVSDSDYFAETV